jgi:iron complex outermembrane recepter protein
MSKRSVFVFLGLIVGLIFIFGDALFLCAQEMDSDEFTLEEITVTAQKRAENQQKVAIPMEVITGDQLAGMGKTNVDDILRDISNVIINKADDGMRVTVRGLTDENAAWHDMHVSTPTVAVNIDGAYNSASSAGQNLFDVERIEVLAGPQSTMYGSNSPGGIVNVVTASPKLDKYSASASVEYGSYDLLNAQAMVNAPIFNTIGLRLAAQKSKRSSWLENSDNKQDSKTARIKALFQPNDKLSLTVTGNYSKSIKGGTLGGKVRLFDFQDGHWRNSNGTVDGVVTNPWTADTAGGAPPPPPPGGGGGGAQVIGGANAMGQNSTSKGIQGEINWDTPIGALSIVPAYSNQEATDLRTDVEIVSTTGTSYTTQFSENHTVQKNLELRLASPSDFFFKWLVGATYYESDRVNLRDDYIYNNNDSYQNTTQKNKAVYGNITYPFTDKFRGNAGYRRSWDQTGNVEIPAKVGNGVTGQKYSSPDYKVGAEYDIAGNSMAYATYATSYRVNAMAIQQGSKTVPPEKLSSYTIGIKNRFLDNKLQVNAAAYYYDYKNKSFRGSNDGRFSPGTTVNEANYIEPGTNHGTDFNNNGVYTDTNLPGGALFGKDITDPWVQQFGAFRSIGADVSADWVVTPNDRLNLSVSYLNAKWKEATIHYYWSWVWPSEGLSFDGKVNTYSPTWTVNASYEHNFELGSFGTLIPHVDVQYKSDYDLSFEPSWAPYNHQEKYYIWNGSVTFTHTSGIWSLNAYVKNARNYAAKTFWMNPAGTPNLGLNDPRTFGGVLSVKF